MREKVIWRPIPTYESLYEISSSGEIRSLSYTKQFNRKGTIVSRFFPSHRLTPSLDTNGYYVVSLHDPNGGRKKYGLHRLVALTFIENPLNLPQVNHKDENKKNNSVSNLEWCTAKYNTNYGTARIRNKKNRIRGVIQCTRDGVEIARYPSAPIAELATNIRRQNIVACLKGRRQLAGGCVWKYS